MGDKKDLVYSTILTEEEKLKIVENITMLPERDKYYVLGFIQAKLSDKPSNRDYVTTLTA